MRERIKIGILLNDFLVPAWEYQIINQIKNSDFSEIVLVIKDNSVFESALDHKRRNIANFITQLIEKADRLVFKTRVDYKLKKDVSDTLKNIQRIDLNPDHYQSGSSLNNPEILAIKDLGLDMILILGSRSLKSDIHKLAKYGIWSYSINNCNDNNLPSPGFWEVIRKIPVTNSTLGILSTGKREPDTIFAVWESTCPYSVNINRHTLSWRSALFAPRIINGLYKYGEDYLNVLKIRFITNANDIQRSQAPITVADAAVSLFRYLQGVTKSITKKMVFSDAFRWQLLFEINEGGDLYSSDYGNFKKLAPPREIFWADPFVISEDDSYFIFVEEFIYKKDRAHISVLKLDKKGNFLGSEKIIERPYHMSYPFIFKVNKAYYMIPETSKNKTIELYRCIEFPYKWEFDRNLMENLSAVDTTLFQFNNKWWLFTAIDQTANISGCSAELFLYFTDDIFSGKWESHPFNPIVSDIRRARPAGNMFIREGKIYRPSQNCAGRYGVAFNINHVTKLTENEYEETLVTEVKPVWNKKLKGTHTLNFDKDFTIIDAYTSRIRISF